MALYKTIEKYNDGCGDYFCFHAANQKEADSKMWGWNRYHGLADCEGWGWRVAVEIENAEDIHESHIHDEWVH